MQFIISTKLHHFPVGLTEPIIHLLNNIYLHFEGGFKFWGCLPEYLQICLISVIYQLKKMYSLSLHLDN